MKGSGTDYVSVCVLREGRNEGADAEQKRPELLQQAVRGEMASGERDDAKEIWCV